jgi:hypothetical protein
MRITLPALPSQDWRTSWQMMQTDRQITAVPQTDRQAAASEVSRSDSPEIRVCLSDEHPGLTLLELGVASW